MKQPTEKNHLHKLDLLELADLHGAKHAEVHYEDGYARVYLKHSCLNRLGWFSWPCVPGTWVDDRGYKVREVTQRLEQNS